MAVSPEEHEKIKKIADNMANFGVPFAKAIVKLRKAEQAGKDEYLSAAEVKAVMDAFRLLRAEH
jgi:hypothetical protein